MAAVGNNFQFRGIPKDTPVWKVAATLPFIGWAPALLCLGKLSSELRYEFNPKRAIQLHNARNEFYFLSSVSILLGIAIRVGLVANKMISKSWAPSRGDLLMSFAFLIWNASDAYLNIREREIDLARLKIDSK